MPLNLPPTLIVEVTRSFFVSITVIVPSRSLVTNANGPTGLLVQAVNETRSNSARNFMMEIAPSSAATIPQHRKAVADAVGRKGQAGPSECDNLPHASPRKYEAMSDRYSTPIDARAPRTYLPETPRQNSDLHSSQCVSLPTAQSSAHSMQTLFLRAKAPRVFLVSSFTPPEYVQ